MQGFKKILALYIDGSVHVALAVVALTAITYMEFNLHPNFDLLACIGFSSIVGYNFVKYFGLAKLHYRSLSKQFKGIQILSTCSLILLVIFAIQLDTKTWIALSVLAIITFLYDFPFLPDSFRSERKRELRQIGGLKIYIIAFVWAGVTLGLPIIESNLEYSLDVGICFSQRMIFVFVLMLPFEIRDLNYDSLKLATIPQKIGVAKTKWLGVGLLVILIALEFFKDDLNLIHTSSLFLIILITVLFLMFSKKQQGRYFCSLWVEAIPIAWFLLMLFF